MPAGDKEVKVQMIGRLPVGWVLRRSLGVAGALCALAQAADAQTQSEIGRGQEIAQRACAGCHAINGSAGSTIQGKTVPTFRAIAGQGWTQERLQDFITTPHRPMSAIPLEMSEIRDVAAYILSLN
jgi:mono/diheme cytochrome c family protein